MPGIASCQILWAGNQGGIIVSPYIQHSRHQKEIHIKWPLGITTEQNFTLNAYICIASGNLESRYMLVMELELVLPEQRLTIMSNSANVGRAGSRSPRVPCCRVSYGNNKYLSIIPPLMVNFSHSTSVWSPYPWPIVNSHGETMALPPSADRHLGWREEACEWGVICKSFLWIYDLKKQ